MMGAKRIVVALLAVVMCGCLAPQNSLMVGVDVNSWSATESLIYENSDTLTLRNLNIAVRYNKDFDKAVLPLKIAVTTPDERCFEEEVELRLQRSDRSFIATTIESLPYRDSAVLAQKGNYIFAFTPLTEVRGIEAIGVEFK